METIGPGPYSNHRRIQSCTTGRQNRKKQSPTESTQKPWTCHWTWVTAVGQPILRGLPSSQTCQPRKEKDRPTAHYVYPTKERQPGMRKTGPRHTASINPKGNSAAWGSQTTGNYSYHPARGQVSGVQNTAGTEQTRNWAIQRVHQSSLPSVDP